MRINIGFNNLKSLQTNKKYTYHWACFSSHITSVLTAAKLKSPQTNKKYTHHWACFSTVTSLVY